jgi:hypothetical protein
MKTFILKSDRAQYAKPEYAMAIRKVARGQILLTDDAHAKRFATAEAAGQFLRDLTRKAGFTLRYVVSAVE